MIQYILFIEVICRNAATADESRKILDVILYKMYIKICITKNFLKFLPLHIQVITLIQKFPSSECLI
jgi:hypothetical protein